MSEYSISIKKPAGAWVLPGSTPYLATMFNVAKKPNWMHRFFMRTLLGWEWRDMK